MALSFSYRDPNNNNEWATVELATALDAYPVGSVYFAAQEDTSPAELFGGTWTRIDVTGYIRVEQPTDDGNKPLNTGGSFDHQHLTTVGWDHLNENVRLFMREDTGGYPLYGSVVEQTYGTQLYFPNTSDQFEITHDSGFKRVARTESVQVEPPFITLACWYRVA